LRLDTISSFEWDELLVAGPYTDLERIDGYQLDRFSNEIKHHDSFIFVGFLKNKKGVKWIELKRNMISDSLFNKNNILLKSNSIFELKR
jgi:hypothetical protein